jgi:hypothetical protein
MYDLIAVIIYIFITFIIGTILLSGYYNSILNKVDNLIKSTDYNIVINQNDSFNSDIQNIELVAQTLSQTQNNLPNTPNTPIISPNTYNTTVERFLFWLYLINSGYFYIYAYLKNNDSNSIDSLVYMNICAIFMFFSTINPTYVKRDKYDFMYFSVYIITYICSLHFSVLDRGELSNIVLTYDDAKNWDAINWIVVILIFSYLIFWLYFQFSSFYKKSKFIFNFYIMILISNLAIFIFASILFTKVNKKKLHIHHYFLGSLLLIFSASYYYPSDKHTILYLKPYIMHIFAIITQAILLGVTIDGMANYGIDTVYT